MVHGPEPNPKPNKGSASPAYTLKRLIWTRVIAGRYAPPFAKQVIQGLADLLREAMDRNEKSLQDCVGPGTSGLVTPYMTTQANGLTNRSAIPSGSSPMSTIDLFNGCLCRAMSGDIGTDTPLKNPFRSEACPLTEDDLLRQSCSDDPYDPRGGIRPECKKLLEEDNKKLVDEYEQWAAKKRCEIAASGAGTTGTYVALATTIDGVTCGEVPAPVVHRSFVSAGCRAIDCAEGECVCSGPNPTDCGCGGVMGPPPGDDGPSGPGPFKGFFLDGSTDTVYEISPAEGRDRRVFTLERMGTNPR